MKFENKVVVITGASTGIGKELAFQLARKGAAVVLAARNAVLTEENAAAIRKEGGRALCVPTDVSRRFQMEALVHRTVAEFGRVDALIANAGISPAKGTILQNSEEDFRATWETNLMGTLYGVWSAVPQMEKVGGGLLVFVGSIIGKRGVPYSAAYCASKFALQGLSEAIRPELAPKNIRVVMICPPGVATEFYKNNGKKEKREYHLHPVGKIATKIIRACEKEKREDLLTWDGKLLHYLNVFAPAVVDRVVAKVKGVSKE